ncbi:MAG: uncharacterized membrane protein HdeD (DUF308 family) [Alteromonadaceae bacterium]|jgi:uncharacterized membrane protein HdeD (DUF308 family)
MNILAIIIGIAISVFVILRFKKNKLEGSKFGYSFLLITFPFYYFFFAVYGNNYEVIALEFLGGLAFFVMAFLSIKQSAFYKFNLLGFGFILHGIYDITHDVFFINAGTPLWWPEFCGVIDLIIGLYLLTLAFRSRVTPI